MIINPAPGSAQNLLANDWHGDSYNLTETLTEILVENTQRIKLLIDNQSNQDCFICFGSSSSNPMRLMPDNLWIEVESAAMAIRAKGIGSIYIAEWVK